MQNDEAVQPNITSYNTLMNAYVAANDTKGAQRVFDDMQNDEAVQPSVTSYNTLMNAYVVANDAKGAQRVFDDMQNDEAVQPNVTSYSTLMNAYVAPTTPREHSACSMRCRMTRRCGPTSPATTP